MPPSAAPECERVGWIFEIIATSAPASKASIAARMPAQPAPTTSTSCFAITEMTLAQGKGTTPGEPSFVDARAAADRFLASPALSEATRRAYGGDVGEFCAWLEDRGTDLDSVDVRVLADYVVWLGGARRGRKLAPATISRKLAAVRAFLRHALGPQRGPAPRPGPRRAPRAPPPRASARAARGACQPPPPPQTSSARSRRSRATGRSRCGTELS